MRGGINASVMGLIPALLVGCGSVDHASGVPIDQAAREISQTICPKAYSCCTAGQLSGNSNAGTDEPSCEQKTQQGYQGQLDAVQTSQDLGRARYDGDKLDACLKTIRSADCTTLNMTNHVTGVPGCETFVTPLVAVGGACSNDYECIDSFCPMAPMTSGDGACQPFAGSGAPCSDQQKCGAGLICDSTTNVCTILATPPTTNACFYTSGCNVSDCRPEVSLVSLAVLALIALARRPSKLGTLKGFRTSRDGLRRQSRLRPTRRR
jgi:hypothetical protein